MTTRKPAIDLIASIRPDIASRDQDVVPEQQREQLLHSITSAALDRSAPVKRRRPLYCRPVVISAFATGAAALALLAVVVIPSGAGSSTHTAAPGKSPGPVVDTAYVIKQLTAAAAATGNDVVYSHTLVSPPASAPGTGYVYDQWYRYASGTSRMVSTGPDGTICLDDVATGIASPASPQFPDSLPMSTNSTTKITAVNHQNRTWWVWSFAEFEWPVPPVCATALGDPAVLGYDYPADYTAVLTPVFNIGSIKEMLSVGQLHLKGNGPIVDGQQTIKLALGPYPSGVSGTVLVSATTYQPLSEVAMGTQGARVETDIQFLPPTAANLARLELTVPTGYRQVPPRIEHAVKKKKK